MNNSKYNELMFITVSSWTQFAFVVFFFLRGVFGIVLLRFCYSRIDLKGFLVGIMLSLSVYS